MDLLYFLRRYAGLSRQEADSGLRRILAASDAERMRKEIGRMLDEVQKEQSVNISETPWRGVHGLWKYSIILPKIMLTAA